ncbi:MAG: hypothetical protein ACI8QG_000807 [Flavobacteriales bacterium]|jgi:hypothetical protein
MVFTMIKNKLLLALSLTAATCLTACGGGGDAEQNVVRDLFAVGEVIEGTEDDGPIEGDVSKNDQGDGLTYALADGSTAANGSLVFNVDGSFIYTPSADFFGTDSISYVVTHTATGQTDTALLTIKVENDFELLEEYGWSLTWSDEFNTDGLNGSMWTGENVSVSEGNLLITAQENMTSSLLAVNSIYQGRVEARIQLPSGADRSSAFGLLPMADMYAGVNSLIALQADNKGLIAGAHYGLGLTSGVSANSSTVDSASTEFHTYAIEWGETQIRWYIDDTHVHTVDTLNTWAYNLSGDDVVVDNAGPYNQDMQIMLKLDADGGELPAVMMVDYIKVWSCDSAIEPDVQECASYVSTKINKAASDRIESLSTVTTELYTDALQELSWHYTDEIIELSIGGNNNPTIAEVVTEDDRGVIIDVTHIEGEGNVSILTPGIELVGRNSVLSFDMYIDSDNTVTETLDIRMETGWPYMGVFKWNVNELELDTWVTYNIAVSDFAANPFVAPDWIGCCVEGGQEGDLLALDTSDVGSLLTVEFFDAVHFQLDNIKLTCTSNESCVQGPLAVQAEESSGGGGVPIRIEAEDFVDGGEVQIEASADEDGGENVGFTDPGDFLEYTVNVPVSGTYTIAYRLAGQNDSDGFEVSFGGVVVDTQLMPSTGGWQTWVTQTGEITLVAGEQTMRLDFIGGQVNINWIELIPPVSEILIEAEDFIDSGEVQIEASADEGGGENVGFTDPGDFLEYTVNIPSDGTYTIQYRLAGQNDSDGFETSFNGVVLDSQPMPSTGGWQTWVTQTGEVILVAGEQTMRLDFIGGQVNINWIKLIKN